MHERETLTTAPIVYVDAAIHPWRGGMWCHLFCADIEFLHAFAARLGLRRSWFQSPPRASWPHYDTNASRREAALRMGAVPADRRTTVLVANDAMVSWCAVHRPDLSGAAIDKRNSWLIRDEARRMGRIAVPAVSDTPAQGSLFLAEHSNGG